MRVQGLGFRVWGLGFWVLGLGFISKRLLSCSIEGLEKRCPEAEALAAVEGSQGAGFRV